MKKISFALLLALTFALLLSATASARRSVPAPVFRAGEVAPSEVCPGQTEPSLNFGEQSAVMLCMLNYAREVNGLAPLRLSFKLGRAAEEKSSDILECHEFSHEACHRAFTFWDQRFGYLRGCWKVGENIAWGTGNLASVRAIVTALLESPEHHANILGPYRQVGFGLRIGTVEGYEDAVVWSQDFGLHQC